MGRDGCSSCRILAVWQPEAKRERRGRVEPGIHHAQVLKLRTTRPHAMRSTTVTDTCAPINN